MIDYQVVLMDFPLSESITKNEDDSYTIFINAQLSAEEQRKKFLHAMTHIIENDFEKTDVGEIENQAHSLEINVELCPVL